MGFYNKPVYVYRLEREGQITSKVSYKSLEDSILISKEWYEYLGNLSIKDSLKKELFTSINSRYFYAIKYAGFLNDKEKRIIIKKIKENKNLLKYCSGKNSAIMFLCKIMGFKLTIKLLLLAFNFKDLLKRFIIPQHLEKFKAMFEIFR